MFMGGMLDITDNYKGNKVEVRKDVVRRDGDDPYLVVAANKEQLHFLTSLMVSPRSMGTGLETRTRLGRSSDTDPQKMGITAQGVVG